MQLKRDIESKPRWQDDLSDDAALRNWEVSSGLSRIWKFLQNIQLPVLSGFNIVLYDRLESSWRLISFRSVYPPGSRWNGIIQQFMLLLIFLNLRVWRKSGFRLICEWTEAESSPLYEPEVEKYTQRYLKQSQVNDEDWIPGTVKNKHIQRYSHKTQAWKFE